MKIIFKGDKNRGSLLVISSFLILLITLLSVAYWKVVSNRILLANQKEQSLRAYYAARAGIEDAAYEFLQGNSWDYSSAEISDEWQYLTDRKFFKTNTNSDALDYFEYLVTYSVLVEGDIDNEIVTVNSTSQVRNQSGDRSYSFELQSLMSKSFDGKIIIHSMIDNPNG